jgi:hypothetical protein
VVVELKRFEGFSFKKRKWRGGTWLLEGKSRGVNDASLHMKGGSRMGRCASVTDGSGSCCLPRLTREMEERPSGLADNPRPARLNGRVAGALLVASTDYTFMKEKRKENYAIRCSRVGWAEALLLCLLLLGHDGHVGQDAAAREMERTMLWTGPKWVKGIVKRFSNLWQLKWMDANEILNLNECFELSQR